MKDNGSPFIVDSCVLIDYASVNPEILSLAVKHIGPVIVTVQVLDEVEEFDAVRAAATGLTVVETDEDLINGAVSHIGDLSDCDKSIFTLAKDRGYTCWTSDSKLKELCEKSGIATCWGLEIMLILCEKEHLGRSAALKTARGIHLVNSYITDEILADFEAKIKLM